MSVPTNPRKALAAKLAEIEKKFPEDDLRDTDYNVVYSRGERAALRAKKSQAIAEAKAECDQAIARVAAAQRRKAADFELGGGRTTKVDHAAVANVRTFLEKGASPKKLIKAFADDEESLTALRWLIENDDIGAESATDEQAEQLGQPTGRGDGKRLLLHQIDRKLFPAWAEQAEEEYVNTEFTEGLAKGHDSVTSLQAAQIAGRRLG